MQSDISTESSDNGEDSEPEKESPKNDKASEDESSSSEHPESKALPKSLNSEAETSSVAQPATADSVPPRAKRKWSNKHKKYLIRAYIELLNRETEEAFSRQRGEHDDEAEANDGEEEDEEALEPSQIGISYWTSDDKEKFFDSIARFGRDALPDVAAAVGKSEPEIREYLLLLEDGLAEYEQESGTRRVMPLEKIPPAAQLSDECCKALEVAADTLDYSQHMWEETQEKKRLGKLWLLDYEVAQQAEDEFKAKWGKRGIKPENDSNASDSENHSQPDPEDPQEEDTREDQKIETKVLDTVPTIELLSLQQFLILSEKIFMNSTNPDTDWRTFGEQRFGPSIRRTAFDDLKTLVVSLTKRIISVAIFQTMSSARARVTMDTRPSVSHVEIHAALDILGLKRDSFQFWINCPRRLGLKCIFKYRSMYTKYPEDPKVGIVSFEDAETYLRHSYKKIREKLQNDRTHTYDDEMDWKSDNSTDQKAEPDAGTDGEEDSDAENGPGLSSKHSEKNGLQNSHESTSEESAEETSEDAVDEMSEESEESSEESNQSSDSDDDDAASNDFETGLALLEKNEKKEQVTARRAEKMEDAELERLDRQFSLKEEDRMWALLDLGDRAPKRKQPDGDDGDDGDERELDTSSNEGDSSDFEIQLSEAIRWRENTEYCPEWETYKRLKKLP